jgi:hypothetical protein
MRKYLLLLYFIVLILGQCPSNWQARENEGNMVCSNYEPDDIYMMPIVANGYLGTLVSSDTIYVGGVYNGYLGYIRDKCSSISDNRRQTPSHRARIPATNSINITNSNLVASALDFERAVFYRRSEINEILVEQQWFAHRRHKHLMVHTISLLVIKTPFPCSSERILVTQFY